MDRQVWLSLAKSLSVHLRTMRVLTRKISSLNEINPAYDEMSLTVYTFWPGWSFNPEWTHPCQKGRDEISFRDEKKMYKHFMCKPNFTMSIFLLNFWRMYSTFFPTLICLNIMKVTRKIFWGLFTESKARKIIFFVQFYKTLFLSLLWSFMYHIECKISDIYFIFHFSVKFIPTIDTIDLCYFY